MNRSILKHPALFLGTILALTGCGALPTQKSGESAYNGQALSMQQDGQALSMQQEAAHTLGGLTYRAVQKLADTAAPPVGHAGTVLVASVVDINDLQESSAFGRLVSEHTSSKLAQLGYNVRELRLRSSLWMKDGTGELILSRDLSQVSKEANAAAIVAGTYATGGKWIYVNLRMLNAETGKIIGAVDFAAPLDADTKKLIARAD